MLKMRMHKQKCRKIRGIGCVNHAPARLAYLYRSFLFDVGGEPFFITMG